MIQMRHAAILLLLAFGSMLNAQDISRLSLEDATKQLTDAGVHFTFGEDPFADSRDGDIVLSNLVFSGRAVTDEVMATYLPAFRNTTRLTFNESTAVTDDTLAVVAQFPNLKDLTILSGQITGKGLHHLAACKQLVLLRIRSNRLTDERLEQLSKLKALPLINLEIGGNGCSDVGLQHIQAFPNLKWLRIQAGIDAYGEPMIDGQIMDTIGQLTNLRSLAIGGNDVRLHAAINDEQLAALTKLPSLSSLTISSREITDEGMRWIGKCESLHRLGLWRTKITDDGIAHLKGLPHLAALYLYDTKITGVGFRALVENNGRVGVPPIRSLVINGMRINDDGIWQISRLKNLDSLQLGCCNGWFQPDDGAKAPITDRGLARITLLPKLTSLHIAQIGSTDVGLSSLSRCRKLENMCVESMPISDDGLERFVSQSKLQSLRINNCPNITVANLKSIQRDHPDLHITRTAE